MIRKNAHSIYTSTLFTSLGIPHAYSTRKFGDMRNFSSYKKFLETAGLNPRTLVTGEQVHGIRIADVGPTDSGHEMKGYDGLVYKKNGDGPVALGVSFADCVPVLATDTREGIIGTAHAGWKGTLAGVTKALIRAMTHAGAHTRDIYVSIGPHIGMCCYNVTEDRALAFLKQFGVDDKIATRILGVWHVDIGYANYAQLVEVGIDRAHIDAPPVCTSCQVADFNSYRKDPAFAFGLQLGVIAV